MENNLNTDKNYSIGDIIPVSMDLSRSLGLHEAIVYGYLLKQFRSNKDEYFVVTLIELIEGTTLSVYHQRQAVSNLKNSGLIDVKHIKFSKHGHAFRCIKINSHV
jgi:hypothetical protein